MKIGNKSFSVDITIGVALIVVGLILLMFTTSCGPQPKTVSARASTTVDLCYENFVTVVSDSCEWLTPTRGNNGTVMHKPSCIYCLERQKTLLKEVLREIKTE